MFGLAGVPSLVMFVGFLFMPESPRWLVFHGRLEKAREVLKRVRHSDEVLPELQSIVKDHEEHTRSKLGKEGEKEHSFRVSKFLLFSLGL